MDAKDARRVIREQDRLAVARILPVLEGHAREARAAADAIPRVLLWSPGRALNQAREAWRPRVERFGELTGFLYSYREHWTHLFAEPENEYGDPMPVTAFHVQGARARLLDLARQLSADAADPALSVVRVPAEVRPPRYARLPDGVSARLLAADLADAIRDGQALDGPLAARRKDWRDVDAWRETADPALAQVPTPDGTGYREIDEFRRDLQRCASPLVAEPYALARAYLAVRLAYLKEVLERMPDYADASGQSMVRPVSITINGSTVTGSQIAGQITNIDSVIAGVADAKVAAALTALQQAVQSQPGLDDAERGALLASVETLAEAARPAADDRARRAATSALTALTFAAKAGGALSQAMATWGDVLHRLIA
jgi:hypothetical protein